MFAPARILKKQIPPLIAVLIIAFIVIAFDKHVLNFSASCPVCQINISLNGLQNPVTVEFHPTVAHHYTSKQAPDIIIPNVLSFENRAPPEV